MSDIAKNIKKLRQKKGLTQEELAEKLFVTRQAVSNWETGKNQPDLDTLKSLAEFLALDIKDVIYGPAPDENRRRKCVVTAVLFAFTAAAWIIYAFLYDEAMYRKTAYFDLRMAVALGLGLRPLAYLLMGAAVTALISIWRELHPTALLVQRGMLAGSAVFLILYLLGLMCIFGVIKSSMVYYYWLLWGTRYPWTFLVPGALLFCGSSRKAG